MEMFNCERFSMRKHPHNLFARTKSGLQYFATDVEKSPSPVSLITTRLPDILKLSDRIRFSIPDAAKKVGFEYGRMGSGKNRMGSQGQRQTPSPFLGKKMKHRVPRGWLYPMLAAFRANVDWDLQAGKFNWIKPPEKLLENVITDLVDVCVTEYKDSGGKPDFVGERESSYRQCYDKVLLHLLQNPNAT